MTVWIGPSQAVPIPLIAIFDRNLKAVRPRRLRCVCLAGRVCVRLRGGKSVLNQWSEPDFNER